MKTGTCSRIIRIILKLKIFNLKGLTPISEKKRVLFLEQKSELNGNLNVKIMYPHAVVATLRDISMETFLLLFINLCFQKFVTGLIFFESMAFPNC